MLWETTDMSETPDEILRALADPERLAIAGLLARGSASGSMLSAALDLPIKRVRSHLNRLASAGVVRLGQDHTSYRLDGGTLEFEPGRRYEEQEVNATVARYFTDHAALRRVLVDEGFLDRDHGEYWRAGSAVDSPEGVR